MYRIEVLFRPLDVLLFRKARPFTLGGHAEGMRIPLPMTLAGAIRTSILEAEGCDPGIYARGCTGCQRVGACDLLDLVGEPSGEPPFVLRGPFLCLINSDMRVARRYYVAPADIQGPKKGKPEVLEPKVPVRDARGAELSTLPPRLDYEGFDFITQEGLARYLKGQEVSEEDVLRLEEEQNGFEFFKLKDRPGLFLNRERRTVEPGYFYRIRFLEAGSKFSHGDFVSAGFSAEILSDNEEMLKKIKKLLNSARITRLGGRSRLAEVRASPVLKELPLKLEEIANLISQRRRFKVYLSSPAVFTRDGEIATWRPKDPKGAELVGVAMKGRRVPISGWDYAKNKMKKLWMGVPAGTVYYFKLTGQMASGDLLRDVLKPIMLENLSDCWKRLGLGTGFVGVW